MIDSKANDVSSLFFKEQIKLLNQFFFLLSFVNYIT